jgi:hypothetical protein
VQTSGIKYFKDIGLVVTTFDGRIKFFDPFRFYLTFVNTNKQRSQDQHTTITCFDCSQQLSLMAVAGNDGRFIVLDPYALKVIDAREAHPGFQTMKLAFFASQK